MTSETGLHDSVILLGVFFLYFSGGPYDNLAAEFCQISAVLNVSGSYSGTTQVKIHGQPMTLSFTP